MAEFCPPASQGRRTDARRQPTERLLEGTLTRVDLNSAIINCRRNARTRRRQRVSLQLTSARSTPVAVRTPRPLLFCPPGTGGRQTVGSFASKSDEPGAEALAISGNRAKHIAILGI